MEMVSHAMETMLYCGIVITNLLTACMVITLSHENFFPGICDVAKNDHGHDIVCVHSIFQFILTRMDFLRN